VRFDDRLLTVLSQPAGDRHDAAVRWRQLVDLVARAGSSSGSPMITRALETIRTDSPDVDQNLRAAAARAVAALPLPLPLLEYFASDSLPVSAPVLAAATLDPDQWRALLAVADDETRRFVETLHPELAPAPTPSLDVPDALVEQVLTADQPASTPPGPSLSEVVARIERRRRSRMVSQAVRQGVAPAGTPSLFRWECGPSGEIAWVEGAPRGPLVGRSIARANGDGVDQEVVRAFAIRAPFRDAAFMLAGEGLLAGEWRISGVPEFEPTDGRFAGYRGVALRDAPAAPAPDGLSSDLLADPDSLRELVHEIKTPLNAIIGFAEIIDGQYLGPADHRYRERAADIVAHAQVLLTAIDDLDFAAKVHSSAGSERPHVKIGAMIERMAPSLRELAAARGVIVDAARTTRDVAAAIEPELADRLIFRTCAAIIERSVKGERLRVAVNRAGDEIRVAISRPAALQGLSEDALFGPVGGNIEEFSLRLVRGLARVAGAELGASASSITLTFPRA
jgi:signal transduction histidine kinase